jgi:hypothetical protein
MHTKIAEVPMWQKKVLPQKINMGYQKNAAFYADYNFVDMN